MKRLHKPVTANSSTNRSRVTNGTQLLIGVDSRSPAGRRFRDLMRGYEAEFVVASEQDRGLIRQVAASVKADRVTPADPIGCSDPSISREDSSESYR